MAIALAYVLLGLAFCVFTVAVEVSRPITEEPMDFIVTFVFWPVLAVAFAMIFAAVLLDEVAFKLGGRGPKQ